MLMNKLETYCLIYCTVVSSRSLNFSVCLLLDITSEFRASCLCNVL
jgi:hypothetical protein